WSTILYGVLFLMCVQSAFFGPCKYGIVPELVKREQLSRANAQLEGLTYLAVVCGIVTASLLSQVSQQQYALAGLACVILSVAGFWTSFKIRRTQGRGEKSASSLFFVKDVWTTFRGIRKDRDLLLAVFASAYFMLIGGFLQMNLVPYGMDILGFTREESGYLFAMAAVGIGIGSFLAGRLSGVNVEIGIVPLGALGLTVSSLALAFLGTAPLGWVYGTIAFMGISAGLFIVPIHALIQLRSPDSKRGQIVAASGFLGWLGVLGSAGLLYLLTEILKISAAHVFAALGILTLLMAVVAVWRLPDFLVRFMIVLMTRTLYRIKVIGAEKIPSQGPALLVSNHVSRSDALIIGSLGQRRIRFVMSREFYEASHLKWLFRLNQAILISEDDPPKQILRALKTAREALDEGYLVCIFAEGGINRNGLLQAFRGGVERIVKGTDYPIIPLYLGGLWGSIFSYSDGKLGGRPKRIPYPVSIHIGDPLPASATRHEIRQKVLELSCDYFVDLKPRTKSPGEQFLRNARRHWGRSCVSDVTGKDLTYGRTATAAQLLANRLKPQTDRQQNVGIMLPPSVAGTLANVALTLLGKTSVNLSYMCSPQVRDTIAERCRLQHILTSRSFLQKLEFGADDPRYIFVEDLMADVSLGEKLRALLKSRFVPLSLLPVTRHCVP
ncbi:MAG: MFS transporter, partial [Planctomycetes bacterium]|nr:MFS transporter [Planctomycetota bacterium]